MSVSITCLVKELSSVSGSQCRLAGLAQACAPNGRRIRPGRALAAGGCPVLAGEEQAVPGVGEEAFVALRAPAPLADQQLVELGGVGGPDDVGGVAEVQAQRGDGGEVGDEAAHVGGAALGDL